MKKNILLRWLDTLELKKYPMSRGSLRDEKGYCPLGVLCELSGLAEWTKDPYVDGRYCYLDSGSTIPLEVCEWAGMSDNERAFVPSRIMAMFDQGVPVEGIIEHLKFGYKIDRE
jgi:hypothetical protein